MQPESNSQQAEKVAIDFSRHVKAALAKRKKEDTKPYTLSAVAKALGLSYSNFRRYLNPDTSGYKDWPFSIVVRLAALLEIPYSENQPQGFPPDNHSPSDTKCELGHCLDEFIPWEKSQPMGPLIVRTLAIDLALGWELVHEGINRTNSRHMIFEILMLTGNPGQYPKNTPQSVLAWLDAAKTNLKHFKQRLADFSGKKSPSIEKSVSIEIRGYREIPTIHGIKVIKTGVPRSYITECGWTAGIIPDYEFGARNYRIVRADDLSEVLQDLVNRYESRFEALWKSSTTLLKKQLGRQAN